MMSPRFKLLFASMFTPVFKTLITNMFNSTLVDVSVHPFINLRCENDTGVGDQLKWSDNKDVSLQGMGWGV